MNFMRLWGYWYGQNIGSCIKLLYNVRQINSTAKQVQECSKLSRHRYEGVCELQTQTETNTNVKFLFKTSHAALILNRNFAFVFMFPFMFVIRKLPIGTSITWRVKLIIVHSVWADKRPSVLRSERKKINPTLSVIHIRRNTTASFVCLA